MIRGVPITPAVRAALMAAREREKREGPQIVRRARYLYAKGWPILKISKHLNVSTDAAMRFAKSVPVKPEVTE